MIDAIEIEIKNGTFSQINAMLVYQSKVLYCNDKKYEVTEELLEKVKQILSTWKHEYGENKDIDIEEFKINVISNGKEYKYHGKGIYPPNYMELKEVIYETIGR